MSGNLPFGRLLFHVPIVTHPEVDFLDLRALARRVQAGELAPEAVSEADVSRALYTDGVPDPDLLIRTSGEMRVSNFLLWQIAYTELWVTPTLWPDFEPADLYRAIADYQRRDRRFGGV